MEIINNTNTSINTKQEDLILEHITIITKGIIKDIEVNNSFASWKNTPIGLNIIKDKTKDFYLGVNMWLTLTENQFLHSNNLSILKTMTTIFPWLENYILLKELMSNINFIN